MSNAEKLTEAHARKEVVLHILTIETHPDERRAYGAELGRLNATINRLTRKGVAV